MKTDPPTLSVVSPIPISAVPFYGFQNNSL